MNQKFIVIDGKTYKNVDEMPEDVRRQYENAMRSLDQNQNGVPDIFENLPSIQASGINVTTATKIIVNGQTYDSLDQLPQEVRAKYEQALNGMDVNHNGIPDFVEGMLNSPNQNLNRAAVNFGTTTPPLSQPIPVSSTIEPESSGGWMLILTGIVISVMCLIVAGVGVWYFFLH